VLLPQEQCSVNCEDACKIMCIFLFLNHFLSVVYRYISRKQNQQQVRHAKIFTIEEIQSLFQIPTETMTQTRDLLIFAVGICTLARSTELNALEVNDIKLKPDGFAVTLQRKKACASRSTQEIWVSGTFFGWNLLDNLKKYLACIPSSGPLWRRIPPSPKNALDFAPLASSTVDSTPTKMASKLKLPNPLAYHSHSLRRTGATLLAIAGRSEEQIKTMGNWSSASAVIRYIENSEVSMRRNARAIAMPGFTAPEFMDITPSDVPVGPVVVQNVPKPVVPVKPVVQKVNNPVIPVRPIVAVPIRRLFCYS